MRAATLCVLLLLAASAWAGEPDAGLSALIQHPALRGARIGIVVEDLATGERLVAHHPDRPLLPASNQKIVTSIAALETWGPAHRFETPVYTVGDLRDGVLHGTLWIAGRGDPGLVSEQLWGLADELRLRGLRGISEGVGVDATHFSDAAHHPDWHPVSQRAYHAPTSAFAANYSAFRIEVTPATQAGALARLDVAPRVDYFRTEAGARTVDGRGRLILDISRLADSSGERVRVSGSVPRDGAPDTYWRSVALPERYAASVLRAQLEAQGIRVGGGIQVGALPAAAVELLRFKGDPVAEHVLRLNKYSNNFVAEQLVKLLGIESQGAPGSWGKGTDSLENWLAGSGLAAPGTVVADGSGLSPRNRIAPATLAKLLRRASRDPGYGPELLASLPLGGRDGTLEDRDLATVPGLRAKTGHLRAVSALSGVLHRGDGRELAFSVLVNGAPGDRSSVDAAIDRFIHGLSEPPGDSPAQLPGSGSGSAPAPGS